MILAIGNERLAELAATSTIIAEQFREQLARGEGVEIDVGDDALGPLEDWLVGATVVQP
jgi:hypothetical protein